MRRQTYSGLDVLHESLRRLTVTCVESRSAAFVAACTLLATVAHAEFISAAPIDPVQFIDQQIQAHPSQTGSYVLEKGEESLLSRAWLADHARRTIDIQYFIWSGENIGILASESLLRAAERGVHVRVIVDDLLMDVPDDALLALDKHPNIEIRIYNPVHSVGSRQARRLFNVATDFRGANQLDPRSENLNTEVGVLIKNARQAGQVADAIEADMLPANSWNARTDDPDGFTSWWKRTRVTFWQWMPVKPLL
jgi:phosphatidylserine/phosphatidylglycerophosphate/cardiolipin synthase-like enzyme